MKTKHNIRVGQMGSKKIKKTKWIQTFALTLLASGCSSMTIKQVGTTYKAPEMSVLSPNLDQTKWQEAVPHNGQVLNLLDWWQTFHDPALSKLIESSVKNNPTLDVTAARIQQARINSGITGTNQLPTVNGSSSITRSNGSPLASYMSNMATFATDASWELDLWGKNKQQKQASEKQLQAAQLDWHTGLTSLTAEVANSYINYKACQIQSGILDANISSLLKTQNLNEALIEEGFAAKIDNSLTQASVASLQQNLAALQSNCTKMIKGMVYLTGMSESELLGTVNAAGANKKSAIQKLPTVPEFKVAQVPVRVISQRPDVAAAEKRLHGAALQINVAEASRYPRVALSGNFNLFGLHLSSGNSTGDTWSLGPSLTVPIFDANRLKMNVDLAKAQYDEALAGYKQVIAQSVQEVETALVSVNAIDQQIGKAKIAVEKNTEFYDLTQAKVEEGFATQFDMEMARRNVLTAQQTFESLQQEKVTDWISLYKAMGGAWYGGDEFSPPTTSNLTDSNNLPVGDDEFEVEPEPPVLPWYKSIFKQTKDKYNQVVTPEHSIGAEETQTKMPPNDDNSETSEVEEGQLPANKADNKTWYQRIFKPKAASAESEPLSSSEPVAPVIPEEAPFESGELANKASVKVTNVNAANPYRKSGKKQAKQAKQTAPNIPKKVLYNDGFTKTPVTSLDETMKAQAQ